MSTDYVYYRVKPGSAADSAFDAQFASIGVIKDFAVQFGKDWLGDIKHTIVTIDDCVICGFVPPPTTPWGAFEKELKAAGISFTTETKAHSQWVRPRAATKRDKALHALKVKWDARPKANGWQWVTRQLFGMTYFCHGLSRYSMYANWSDGNRLVGIPWLAANGFLQDWGNGQLKLAEGLIPIPFDEAMWLVYKNDIEDIKKARMK